MPDTQRDVPTLIGLLADNTTGDISAQDSRDVLVSTVPDWGEVFVSAAAATTIGGIGTFVKMAGTTTLSSGAKNFTMPTNNRLLFGGDATRRAFCAATVSFTTASGNQIIAFRFAKNGATLPSTEVRTKVGTGTDIQAVPLTGTVSLAPSDYLEVWVTNLDSASNMTAVTMCLSVMVLPA